LKKLLTLTAIFEGTTGLALLIAPNFVVSFLLGTTVHEPVGIFMSRLPGVALITLSIICWLYRNNEHHSSGIVKALLFYNSVSTVLLVIASVNGFSGIGIWPAALLHVVLSGWCIKTLL